MNITAIILAGGKSTRMGTDKGLVSIKGKPMIEYLIDLFKAMELPIIIVANNHEYTSFGYPVYEDIIPDKGPIGGLYTGLMHSETEYNIVVSCDVPFISKELLLYLLDRSRAYDVTIPKMKDRIHPLIGIYKQATKGLFKEHLDADQLKLLTACLAMTTQIIDVTNLEISNDLLFSNINTQADIEKLI